MAAAHTMMAYKIMLALFFCSTALAVTNVRRARRVQHAVRRKHFKTPPAKTCKNMNVNCGPRFTAKAADTACTACTDDGNECCTEIAFNKDNGLREFGLHITAKQGVTINGQQFNKNGKFAGNFFYFSLRFFFLPLLLSLSRCCDLVN